MEDHSNFVLDDAREENYKFNFPNKKLFPGRKDDRGQQIFGNSFQKLNSEGFFSEENRSRVVLNKIRPSLFQEFLEEIERIYRKSCRKIRNMMSTAVRETNWAGKSLAEV